MADNKETKTTAMTPEEEKVETTVITDEDEKAANAAETPEDVKAADADKAAEEETDEALSSFLNREQKEKKPGKLTDFHKRLILILAIIAVVTALVLVLVNLRKKPAGTIDEEAYLPAEIALSVDNGVHEAVVATDDDGNIKQNGAGSLLTYVPANIKKIQVENKDGSFEIVSKTPEGQATVYTVVGFEEYDLQSGIADEIAGDCAALDFSKVISADGNLADYGLETPRATVTVTYDDKTSAVIRIGDNAPGETGTYVAFGNNNAVYLVEVSDVSNFFYSVNNLISLDITETVDDSANAEFSSLTISGTHYDEPITLEPNTDEAIGFTYLVTAPRKMFADEIESHDIAGNVRGLYAESVAYVNPGADKLKSFGLSDPYAKVEAVYPDATITLSASAPKDDGTVYLYNPDKKIVYTIQLAAVCWAKTGLDLLTPENPLNVKMAYVKTLDFSAGDTDFTLDITTVTNAFTDDSGTEQQTSDSTATYNGKELDHDNFYVFFQNINAIKNLGWSDEKAGSKVMSVTFGYTTDRADDTLSVYTCGSDNYLMEFNGEKVGTVSKKYIEKLIQGANNLISGKTVEGL